MDIDFKDKVIKNTYFLKEKIDDQKGIVSYSGHAISRNIKINVSFFPMPDSENARLYQNYLKSYISKLICLNELNLVKYLEIDTYEGRIYFVKESISGTTLSQFKAKNGIKTIYDAIFIVIQISNALLQAHKLKISHNLLNPEQIIVFENLGAVVGIKIDGFESFILQKKGYPKDVKYSRPAFGNDKSENPDFNVQADIMTIGRLFYWLLTDKYPDLLETGNKKQHFVYPSSINSDVPKMLDTVIYRMLSNDSDIGYQDIEEYAKLLMLLCRGEKIFELKTPEKSALDIKQPITVKKTETVAIKSKIPRKKQKLSELITVKNDNEAIARIKKHERPAEYDAISAKYLKSLFANLLESKGKLILIEKNDADAFKTLFDYYYYFASYNNSFFLNINLDEDDSVKPFGLIKSILDAYEKEMLANAAERNEVTSESIKGADGRKLYQRNDLFNKLKRFSSQIENFNSSTDIRLNTGKSKIVEEIVELIIELLKIKKPFILLAHQVEWIDDESNSCLAKMKDRITRHPILIIGVYSTR